MPGKSDIIIKISGQAESFQNELRQVSKDVKGLENGLLKVAKVSSVAFVGLAGSIGLAVNQAAKFEQIETQFQVLTGSVKTAQRAIKGLSDFSARTPFQFEDIAKAGQQLLAFGFSADELTEKLGEIGDVAAASGQPIKDLTQIFGQVAAAGKLTGERLNQLQERAVPIGPAIAKTMGVAESAVRDLVSRGEVDFKTFEKAFRSLSEEGGLAFNGMEKQSKTLSGQISTLKDNFSLLVKDLGVIFVPILKEVTSSMISFLQTIRQNQALVKTVGIIAGIGTALAGLVTALTLTGVAVLKFRNTWIALNTTFAAFPKLAAAAAAAAQFAGRAMVAALKNPIGLIITAIVSLFLYFDELRDGAVATFKGLSKVIDLFGNNVSKVFSSVRKIIKNAFKLNFGEEFQEGIEELKELGVKGAIEYAKAFDEEYKKRRKERADEELDNSSLDAELDALRSGLEKRGEIENEARTKREEDILAHAEKVKNINEEFRKLDESADLLYHETILRQNLQEKRQRVLDEQKYGKSIAGIKAFWRSQEVQGLSALFGQLSQLQRSNNKTAFRIGKLGAIARATINIAQGVTEALKYGPFIGPALATAIGAAGAVQLNTIRTTPFQAKDGFAGSGRAYGETFVSTFSPREVTIPENFSQGIKKGEYRLQSAKDTPEGGQEMVKVELSLRDELIDFIEVKSVERKRLGVSSA